MSWRTVSLALAALLCSGCLRQLVKDEAKFTLASRYVHTLPIERVWEEAVKLLQEQGYSARESAHSFELVTDWKTESNDSAISGTYSRYLVYAERLEADQTLVRFIRVNASSSGIKPTALTQRQGLHGLFKPVTPGCGERANVPCAPGGKWSRRDLRLEWRLVERLRPELASATDALIEENLSKWWKAPEETGKGSLRAHVQAPRIPVPSTLTTKASAVATAAGTSPGPAAPSDPFATPLPGEEEILRRRVVLFGETPGTVEIPAYLRALLQRSAASGRAVHLGLEIPAEEQGRIDAYLQSPGSAEDRAALLAGGFWRRAWQDGRSSAGVLGLIEAARGLRARGKAVSVFAYDVRGLGGNPRQEEMARRVLARHRQAPEGLVLVLTGNVQARIVGGTPWDPGLVPMGARLAEALPDLLALDVHHAGGVAWTCRLVQDSRTECGEGLVPIPQRARLLGRGMASNKDADGWHRYPRYVRVDREVAGGAHHGIFYLGRVSASGPAIPDQRLHTVVR